MRATKRLSTSNMDPSPRKRPLHIEGFHENPNPEIHTQPRPSLCGHAKQRLQILAWRFSTKSLELARLRASAGRAKSVQGFLSRHTGIWGVTNKLMTGRTVSLIHSPTQQPRPHGPDCSYQGHARQPSEAPAILEARAQAMGALQLQTRRRAGSTV